MPAKGKITVKKKKVGRKANLMRLYSEMNKLAVDAVDKEVTKRFKTLIDTAEEDITKTSLMTLLKDPKNIDLSSYHEALQAYIKHYLFMIKRGKKKKKVTP